MTTLLLAWYASGWAMNAAWAIQFDELTIGQLLLFFCFGPAFLLFEMIGLVGKCLHLSTVIWQKKPR